MTRDEVIDLIKGSADFSKIEVGEFAGVDLSRLDFSKTNISSKQWVSAHTVWRSILPANFDFSELPSEVLKGKSVLGVDFTNTKITAKQLLWATCKKDGFKLPKDFSFKGVLFEKEMDLDFSNTDITVQQLLTCSDVKAVKFPTNLDFSGIPPEEFAGKNFSWFDLAKTNISLEQILETISLEGVKFSKAVSFKGKAGDLLKGRSRSSWCCNS